MIIVAERINASRKPVREALEKRDADFIREEARRQAGAGADYIDVNGGTFPGLEPELLCWLVETVQEVISAPLCLDSPDPDALAAGLERVKGPPPMINSITLEDRRFDRVLHLALEHRAKLIALCQGDAVVAPHAKDRVELASRLVDRLTAAGLPLEDIFVDPLVFPIATDSEAALQTLDSIGGIRGRFPGVHAICGLTNVSHGLPARRLLNRTFLVAAMARGLDAAIIDPTDPLLMASLRSAEAILGRDEYCMGFIGAFRAGKLE